MTTRNLVPRADGEGSLGTEAKQWGAMRAKKVYIDGTDFEEVLEDTLDAADAADDAKTQAAASATEAAGSVVQAEAIKDAMIAAYGYPLTAATAADMTDTTKIYVYTGIETGYTFGDWYYHNGTAWTDGGVYNAIAFNTDPTLSISGDAADSKVVGDNFATVLRLLSNDATSIPSSSDLDDYTTPSNYKVANSTTAATITHAPLTTHAYRLVVLQISEIATLMQIALVNKANGQIYIRRKDETWKAWEKVATGSDVDEITAALQKSFSFDSAAATIIPNGTNLNTLTTVGNYKVTSNDNAATMTNCPVSAAFMLKVLNTSTTSTNAQILIPNAPSTGSMYYRLSATATWHKITDERDTIVHKKVILTSSNYTTYWPNGSFNDAEPNTIYGINEDTYPLLTDGPSGNGVTGQPSNQSVPDSPPAVEGRIRGTLITYSQVAGQGKQSGLVQLYVGYRETEYSPILAYRIAVYTDNTYKWSNWAKFEQNGYLHAGNQIVYGGQPYISNAPFTDLNDAPGNSIYHVDLNMDGRDADHTLGHHPTPGYSSIVITYSFSYTTPHARMQMVCSIDGRMYWRYGYLQATDDYRWTGWNQCVSDNGDYMRNKGRLTNGTDLNSVTDNSIYLLGANNGAGYVNDPITGAGFLTTKATNAIILQTIEALAGTRYSRYSDDGGTTWSNWV